MVKTNNEIDSEEAIKKFLAVSVAHLAAKERNGTPASKPLPPGNPSHHPRTYRNRGDSVYQGNYSALSD